MLMRSAAALVLVLLAALPAWAACPPGAKGKLCRMDEIVKEGSIDAAGRRLLGLPKRPPRSKKPPPIPNYGD